MQDKGRFLGAVALAVGLVIAAWIAATALGRVRSQEQTITVTGSARLPIVSDTVFWQARVWSQAPQMNDAYRQLSASAERVVAYLQGRGVKADQIEVSAVSTRTLHPRTDKGVEIPETILAYRMTQHITVRSGDVRAVAKIAREVTELINEGVFLESDAPEYRYSKLADVKIQLLGEAARDARARAVEVAASTGAQVGALRGARMGVLQINPPGSVATSAEGNYDLGSIEKDVIAVVTCSFAIR